jgi:hypothetical protein
MASAIFFCLMVGKNKLFFYYLFIKLFDNTTLQKNKLASVDKPNLLRPQLGFRKASGSYCKNTARRQQ